MPTLYKKRSEGIFIRKTAVSILFICLSVLAICACGFFRGSEEMEDGVIRLSREELAGYTVIRPADADEKVSGSAVKLRRALEDFCGSRVSIADDYLSDGEEPAANEILVGLTDRQESREAFERLSENEGGIFVIDGKPVIIGKSDELTEKSVELFISKYLGSSDGYITLSADLAHRINWEHELAGYRIVYPSRKAKKREYVIAVALRDRIREITGLDPEICDDAEDAAEKEILIGDVDRPEAEKLYSSLDRDHFGGYARVGDRIVIFGSTETILDGASDLFTREILGYDNTQKKQAAESDFTPLRSDFIRYIDGGGGGDRLYNGIVTDATWPPRTVDAEKTTVIDAPYLVPAAEGGTHPGTVDISVGRQLFVDSFLISRTDLKTVYHSAVTSSQPVITMDDDYLMLKTGYVMYDEETDRIVMWYGGMKNVYRAESRDGVVWSEPEVVFTNDSKGAWITVRVNPSPAPDGNDRYIMLVRNADGKEKWTEHYETTRLSGRIYKSADGRKWTLSSRTGAMGDASTLSYNRFRNKWLIFARDNCSFSTGRRVVRYFECSDITSQAAYGLWQSVDWQRTDRLDIQDPKLKEAPQIYSVCSDSYESIQLGMFQYWLGPSNSVIAKTGLPKITELQLGYSRDGFYFTRPERKMPFISCSRKEETWDYGYLHPVSSLCVATQDELLFWYSGYRGGETDIEITPEYANPSIGIARLRRDGFASLDGTGSITTCRLTAEKGKKYLFVNADAASLRAELYDADGNVIDGYSAEDCIPFTGDSCCTMLSWKNGKDVSFLAGKEFSVKFVMEDGSFYSFWLSDCETGDSGGYCCGGLIDRKTAKEV